MAARSKPLVLVQGHRTKAEIETRSKAEEALASSQKFKASKLVKGNPAARKYHRRVTEIFKDIDMDDAFYENVLNRYCILLAEHDELVKTREKAQDALTELYERKDEMELSDFLAELKNVNDVVVAQDKALAKKRDQLLSIEKENLMTAQGKLRAVPKKAEKKELSGIAAYMQRRENG